MKIINIDEIKNEVLNLTLSNRRMSDRTISNIISENPQFEPISSTLVNTIRHDLNFNFLPPIHLQQQRFKEMLELISASTTSTTEQTRRMFFLPTSLVLN